MRRNSLSQARWILLLTIATGPAVAQQSADPPQPVGVIGAPAGTGPYVAVAESFASMRHNTVYRPANMPKERLPLILWGNGGCRDNGLNNGAFLREVASHGFVIIAAGVPRVERVLENPLPRPSDTQSPPPPPSPRAKDPTQPQQLLDAIGWMRAQSADRNSVFFGKVDVDRLGAMGHSCGGLQALSLATDPRTKTAILFNSGVLNDGPESGRSGIAIEKSELEKVHGPIAYINGGPTDIAYKNALDDFSRLSRVPVFFGENGVGHGGTFWSAPNGGDYAKVATAWMSWQLKGDSSASKMFLGKDCGLCVDASWKVRSKLYQ
jgi:hypothetical protein